MTVRTRGIGKWGVLVVILCLVPVLWFFLQRVSCAAPSNTAETARAQLADLGKHDPVSTLFRTIVQAVQPAVVVVHVKQKVAYENSPIPDMDEFLRRFFGDEGSEQFQFRRGTPQPRTPQQPQQQQYYYRRGLGSGVVVDAEKGYVLTNWHVVESADEVKVLLPDGRDVDAEWVRTDQQTDVAVIKIKADKLTACPLGDSDAVQVGDQVLAFGAPEGLPQTVTAGIISARGRTTGGAGYENFLQTDASINHGNSGGPLVNMSGEVIGINAAIVSRTGVNEGIGLAVPSNMVKGIMQDLIEKGSVVRGHLGVLIQSVNDNLARSFGLPDTHGALVAEVEPDSPARQAGIEAGDFIVAVDGKTIDNPNELRNRVASLQPGHPVRLDLFRQGKKMTVEVTLSAQTKSEASGTAAPGHGSLVGKLGIKVQNLTPALAEQLGQPADVKGVIVTEVDPGSAAAESGLETGMVVTQVQDKKVATVEQFNEAVAAAKGAQGVRVLIRTKEGAQQFVFLPFAH